MNERSPKIKENFDIQQKFDRDLCESRTVFVLFMTLKLFLEKKFKSHRKTETNKIKFIFLCLKNK